MAYIHKKKRSNRPGHKYDLRRRERNKIYNSARWQQIRAWKVVEQPLCEMCLQDDKVTPVEEVHHIVSFMSTDDPIKRNFLAYDYSNLMSVCQVCHQKIHNR